MSSSDEESVSSDIMKAADEAMTVSATIPERSRSVYESCYRIFCEWLKESKIKTITQQVMLAYFMHKSKDRQSSTMWSEYSKLKCMTYLNQNVDISKFVAVSAFLKRKSIGHVAKKSSILTRSHFDRFITETPDNEYLMMKAALIIGMAGALRREELLKLATHDVVDTGEDIRIDVMDSKTHMHKQFVMTESNVGNCNLMGILRKYMSQRNATTPHARFFVGCRQGKCTTQPVGINTIGAIPKKIAMFLGLNGAENFTGHCIRRSSAQVLADFGAEFSVFKRIAHEGLRRMIPNYKQQSEGQTSSDGKLQLKIEPNPLNESDNYENVNFQHHDDQDLEEREARQNTERESKQQIFNINYVVPSSLIIREHQTEQHTGEASGSYQQSSAAKDTNRTTDQPSTDESDQDHNMEDDPGEVLPDDGKSYSLSTQEKIDHLKLREMENRVTESRLRCKVQQLIVNKAEEEFKHMQEMNRLRVQEAKMRLKLLEQNCASGGVNVDSLNSV